MQNLNHAPAPMGPAKFQKESAMKHVGLRSFMLLAIFGAVGACVADFDPANDTNETLTSNVDVSSLSLEESTSTDHANVEPDTAQDPRGPVTNASGWCPEPFCSKTWNFSDLPVYTGRDWQCAGGTTGTVGGESCVASANRRWISSGDRTPAWNDWDAFRVDAGWCYKVQLDSGLANSRIVYYNRIGLGSIWVKVQNEAQAAVLVQRTGACP